MSLNPDSANFSGGTPRKLVPAGQQIARNYAIVDLGTQTEQFQGQEPTKKPKVLLMFEFPEHKHVYDEKVGPETLTMSQEYTFIASDRSKLPAVLQAWGSLKTLPSQLNLKPYLGQYCMIMVEHKPKKSDPTAIRANIMGNGRSISPIHPSMKQSLPAPSRPNVWFDLDNFSWEVYNSFPKYVKEWIAKSAEWPSVLVKHPAPVQQAQATIATPTAAQPAGNFALPNQSDLSGGPLF